MKLSNFQKLIYFTFIILLSLSKTSLYSQQETTTSNKPELPNIIPPSPTVANLMHFEEVPVDHHTGQPDISIPIYSKNINTELSIPIALRYNTMGVRIQERSGWVGTGWSLEAGGVISRTVRGAADETIPDFFNKNTTGVAHLPDFWNWDNLPDNDKNEFLWNVNGTKHIRYDSEPDLYQFSMLGQTGRFMIDGNMQPVLLTKDIKVDIIIDYDSVSKQINSFLIIDPNGYRYLFTEKELSTTTSRSTVYPRSEDPVVPHNEYPQTVTTAWHLTSISTSNGFELISFGYTSSTEEYATPRTYTEYRLLGHTQWNIALENDYSYTQFRPLRTVSYASVETVTKKLSLIDFKDGSKLKFLLSSTNSHPENNGEYLTEIRLVKGSNESVERTFNFVYEDPALFSRLWLKEVKVTNAMKYAFEYFEKDQLPDTNGYEDAWGYNNGDHRDDPAYGFNVYDFNAYRRGLLTKITFPTGGAKEFSWQPHTFSYEGASEIGDYDSNPYNTDTQLFPHQFQATTDNLGTQTPGEVITFTHGQYIQVELSSLGGATGYSDIFEVKFVNSNPDLTFRVDIDALQNSPQKVFAPEGTYVCSVRVKPTMDLMDTYTLTGHISVRYTSLKTGLDYKNYLLGGGVRIGGIKFTDPQETQQVQRNIDYYYNMEEGLTHDLYPKIISSGSVDAKLGSMFKRDTLTDRRYIFMNSQRWVNSLQVQDIQYDVLSNERTAHLSKGNYVGYQKVTVSDQAPFTAVGTYPNGYTEYYYKTARDFPVDEGTFYYPYKAPNNIDYKRGNLIKKIVYNKDHQKLEEVENTYEYPEEIIDLPMFTVTEALCEWRQFYEEFQNFEFTDDPEQPEYPVLCLPEPLDNCFSYYGNCNLFAYNYHPTTIKIGRAELIGTTRKQYFYNGSTPGVVESTTSYTYNPINYQLQQQIVTYEEGADVTQEKTTYEYPVGGYDATMYPNPGEPEAITKMAALNIVNKPLIISQYKNNELLQKVINKYKEFDNDQVLLHKVETLKGGSTSTAAEERIFYNNYDEKGNVLDVSVADGTHTQYIWGYNNSLPVAKISNIFTPVPSALITAIHYADEATMATALEALYSESGLAETQITTLTYDICKGVTSVTDPRQYTLYYDYDNLGRLQWVKDDAGNKLTSYTYHYRTQHVSIDEPTQTMNYVKTTTYRDEASLLSTAQNSVTYFDGLGRQIQSVAVGAGGQGQDVITPFDYDNFGRQAKSYLPYADAAQTVSSFEYRDNTTLIPSIESYYLQKYPADLSAASPNPYSESVFEASPLNRPVKQAAPGESWKAGTNDHTIKFDYHTNASGEVIKFKVIFPDTNDTENPQLAYDGYYQANQLYKTITKDENWTAADGKNKTTEEFKDVAGRVILKRTYDAGEPHDTYYVYDKFSNLTYVIPPLAADDIVEMILVNDFIGINYPWTYLGRVNQQLADNYERELSAYDNSEILNIDLLDKYGGQGGFSIVPDNNGGLVVNINMTIATPMPLKTGIIADLKELGTFADKELGRISGTDYEYYFLIKNNMLEVSGDGDVPSLNVSLTGATKLEYTQNYPWTSVCIADPQVVADYERDIAVLDNSEILTTYTPNNYNAMGGLNISLNAQDVLTLSLSITTDQAMELKSGAVFPLNIKRRVNDMVLGTAQGAGYQYDFSIRDNSLVINGSGYFNSLNFVGNQATSRHYQIRQEVLEGLCYIYHYDKRNRVVEKHIPGKGWEDIIYDRLDRVVLTRDQNLKADGKWLFTKYDVHGRVAFTGQYAKENDRPELQAVFNDPVQVPRLYVIPKKSAYHNGGIEVDYINDIFPDTNIEVFTVSHYDEYENFNHTGITVPSTTGLGDSVTTNTKGLATGSKVRILDTTDWITAVNAFNEKGQNIWSHGINTFLGTDDVVEASPNFTGQVVKSKKRHRKAGVPDITMYDLYEYDRMGRLLKHTQAQAPLWGANLAADANMITLNIYDELGQLKVKKVGGKDAWDTYKMTDGLQTIDYSYNIRGWLKMINNPNQALGDDLFAFKINYNSEDLSQSTPLYNGNIAETHWKTRNDNRLRSYSYQYDALNRLKDANYEGNYLIEGSQTEYENYTERGIQYDKNGNITALERWGITSAATPTVDKIDVLSYEYEPYSNRLRSVIDNADSVKGFRNGSSGTDADYAYDDNGNMHTDRNKSIGTVSGQEITYNHLNLPKRVTFDTAEYIEYHYDATGIKMQKKVRENGLETVTQYCNGFIYSKSGSNPYAIEYIPHPEGYAVPGPVVTNNGLSDYNNFEYIYQYKDHLGNVRLSYSDADGNASIANSEIIEEDNYYAFGMKHAGYNTAALSSNIGQKIKYNGKEYQNELDLNWFDYGARNYDSALGRWMNIDPLAENHFENNPFMYANNNPVIFIDPDGMDFTLTGKAAQDFVGNLQREMAANDGTDNEIRINTKTKKVDIIKNNNDYDSIVVDGKHTKDAQKGVYTAESLTKQGYMVFEPNGAGMAVTDFGLSFAGGEMLFAKLAIGVRAWWAGRAVKSSLSTFERAAVYGINSYNNLTKAIKGTGLEAHHLIEKRFASTLGVKSGEMYSIALTNAEHQMFTNAWRARIGYDGSKAAITTSTATKKQIYNAAREIYKNYPEILKTLGL